MFMQISAGAPNGETASSVLSCGIFRGEQSREIGVSTGWQVVVTLDGR